MILVVVLNECLLFSAFSCMAEIEAYMLNKFSIMCFVLPLPCPVKMLRLTTVWFKCDPLKNGLRLGDKHHTIFCANKTTGRDTACILISPANLSQRGRLCWRVPTKRGLSFCYVSQFPHSAFARGPRSPAFEERMWAAMGATGERSAGRPPYPEWHVYWFLLISTRDIKLCHNLYLSFYRRW